jgi:peptide/nickel transport system substrate-binding protein
LASFFWKEITNSTKEERIMKHKNHFLVAILIIASLVLGACTPQSTPVPQATQPPAQQPAQPEATQPPAQPAQPEPTQTPAQPTQPPAPAVPQTLTIASGTDIENLNIRRVTSSPSFSVLEHIYETLFYMTSEGELEPLLAESIEAGQADNTFIIRLRQGVQFTDGESFNAEAVKANLDWILENNPVFGFLINRIQEVTVVDEYTVQLTLNSDFAPLAAHLSHGAIAMISPALLAEGEEAMAARAVGTGPFVLADWSVDEAVTLERNPNYWGEASNLDTVVFRVVKEDGARIVEIEAGTVDVAVRIPPAEAQRLASNPNIDIIETPGLRTIYIFFNVTNEPFDDVRVRQAVNYAVDVEAIVRDLFNGAARVSDAPVAPAVFGYSAQPAYARDVARARQLLQEAGVPEGTTVTLYHPTGRYIQDALVADAVRSQLREVGLNAVLQTLEWPQYVPHVRRTAPENDIQFAMLGWGTVTMDADYGLFALFHSSEVPPGFNGAFYNNPEVDRLLDEARTTLDTEVRRQLYDQAISIIWEDAPWLFLYSELQLTAVRNNVSGFVVHPDESLIATGASKR